MYSVLSDQFEIHSVLNLQCTLYLRLCSYKWQNIVVILVGNIYFHLPHHALHETHKVCNSCESKFGGHSMGALELVGKGLTQPWVQ